MSTVIIINPKVKPAAAASVESAEGSISVVNPDGQIAAHGFPSNDYAHGWLYAMVHCHRG